MKVIEQIAHTNFGRVERVLLDDGTVAARKVFEPNPVMVQAAQLPGFVEALQLAYRSRNPRLHQAMQDYPEGVGMPARVAEALRFDILREPDMSRTLRQYLQRHLKAASP